MSEDMIKQLIESSYHLLEDYEKKGRYFHTLTPEDNSPVVVHKKTNQLTYIMDGEGIAVLNGQEIELKKGSVVLVEAGTTHQFFVKSKEMILFHIHIPDEGRENDRYILEGEDYNRYE